MALFSFLDGWKGAQRTARVEKLLKKVAAGDRPSRPLFLAALREAMLIVPVAGARLTRSGTGAAVFGPQDILITQGSEGQNVAAAFTNEIGFLEWKTGQPRITMIGGELAAALLKLQVGELLVFASRNTRVSIARAELQALATGASPAPPSPAPPARETRLTPPERSPRTTPKEEEGVGVAGEQTLEPEPPRGPIAPPPLLAALRGAVGSIPQARSAYLARLPGARPGEGERWVVAYDDRGVTEDHLTRLRRAINNVGNARMTRIHVVSLQSPTGQRAREAGVKV